jgi:murein DD-endopeptidase MepM/ murein hydrolase activator NlpD
MEKNGLMSVYSNLDNNVNIKKGDKVKKDDCIGKVGNTTLKTRFEKYGSHLHFSMLEGNGSYEERSKANKFIDPSKYVDYEKIQEEPVKEEKTEKTMENTSEEKGE